MKTHSFLLLLLVLLVSSPGYAQKASAQKSIERANQQFIRWFNNGKADSILLQYHPKACLANGECGTAAIKNHYESEVGRYTFREITTVSVTANDTLATETGRWRLQLASGSELSGNYRTEWRKVRNTWLIFRESMLD